LVLTQSKEQTESGQDGFFTFEEIINLNWDAELVVLSACQTGKGEMKKTEGVVGLTRAVMYAGSDAVVVSLWNVSDEGTKDLMIQFFDNILNKKMTKSDALRDAKLKFIKDKKTPFIWSPFVMYGE
jgi:CHAT domain-containing protein